jgi:AhpC/TSA family protein
MSRPSAVAVCVVLAIVMIGRPTTAGPLRVPDLDGRFVDPLAPAPDVRATVFVFITTDCPIANRYAPDIQRLAAIFTSQGVRFWLVYANPHEPLASIRNHLRQFQYAIPALRDPEHALVRFTKVTVSPEAAVVDQGGMLLYHGRIDDRWVNLGRDRPSPTHSDLAEALRATLDGKPVAQTATPAVGCILSDFLR